MSTEIPAIPYDELFTSRGGECYLGQGAFSQVVRCYHRTYGDVAVKILDSCSRNPITSFNKEGLMHLKACTSDHILTLHGIAQCQGFVGLVLEYMPYGCLADHIFSRNIEMPWTFRLRALSEVAFAIHYLHHLTTDKRLIHCDLKVENILLSGDLHAKIGDFGGASLSSYTGANFQSTTQGPHKTDDRLLQYTLSYAAPEVLGQLDARRTPYMDIYSFAIITYVTTSRYPPFDGSHPDVLKHAVKDEQRPSKYLEEIEEDLQDSHDDVDLQIFRLFKHLMGQCWKHEPRQRLQMENVRDSLCNKLRSFPVHRVEGDIQQFKRQLRPGAVGMPQDPIHVQTKYLELRKSGSLGEIPFSTQRSSAHGPSQPMSMAQGRRAFNPTLQPSDVRSSMPQPAPRNQPAAPRSADSSIAEEFSRLTFSGQSVRPKELVRPSMQPQVSSTSLGIRELEASFADPYLRQGNAVRMIGDLAAIKNAQVGHGGWNDLLLQLRDNEGIVTRVEDNGDVTVSFSGIRSHRFNPSSLAKIPLNDELHVGDYVNITLEKELVAVMQEGHGGWVEEMHQYFKQRGLIFRFLPDKDVLVVYSSGMYFRFNPEVLQKYDKDPYIQEVSLNDNPHIKIGDYVCHDMDDELLKELQENCGGWNSAMTDLRGRVGKFVYADYHGRAFVAYSSKLCFVFSPAALHKLSREEASLRFSNAKGETKRLVQARVQDQIRHHRFAVDDIVRVHLPLDIVIELQRGHGGWCYQMLEVYGMQGVVKDFDEGGNAQVLFDTGNKWTFNPTALEKLRQGENPLPSYVPPFRIGDKVRVRLKDLNNASLNKMRQAFKMLDIPEEKVEILMKSGTVLGIDDDVDVIVSFGDGKNYGLKPEQLEKL